jgi:hypothetical protein
LASCSRFFCSLVAFERQRILALRAIIQAQLIVCPVLQLWLLLVLLGNQSVSIRYAYSAGGHAKAEAEAIFEVRPDLGVDYRAVAGKRSVR